MRTFCRAEGLGFRKENFLEEETIRKLHDLKDSMK